MTTTETLTCGHAPSEHGPHTTGYAEKRNGDRICYECADREQIEEMKTAPDFFAYLSSDMRNVTTWTGGKLARVTSCVERWHNIARTMFYFRAVDVHGARWFGRGLGGGMYCRIRRAKVTQ